MMETLYKWLLLLTKYMCMMYMTLSALRELAAREGHDTSYFWCAIITGKWVTTFTLYNTMVCGNLFPTGRDMDMEGLYSWR